MVSNDIINTKEDREITWISLSLFYAIGNYADCHEFVKRKQTNLANERCSFFYFMESMSYKRKGLADLRAGRKILANSWRAFRSHDVSFTIR